MLLLDGRDADNISTRPEIVNILQRATFIFCTFELSPKLDQWAWNDCCSEVSTCWKDLQWTKQCSTRLHILNIGSAHMVVYPKCIKPNILGHLLVTGTQDWIPYTFWGLFKDTHSKSFRHQKGLLMKDYFATTTNAGNDWPCLEYDFICLIYILCIHLPHACTINSNLLFPHFLLIAAIYLIYIFIRHMPVQLTQIYSSRTSCWLQQYGW